MNLKSCAAQVEAHGRSEISAMIQSRWDEKRMVTIAHDGLIKLWDIDTMELVSSARIRCGYLTSLLNFEKGYLVGTGNGEIVKFSGNLQREWTRKIHSDCVNDMLETDLHLISIGSDGKAIFMLKPTLSIEKELELGVPLTKMTLVGEEIYVAGNPSFSIDLRTFQTAQLGRSFHFISHKGKVLGCSDEKGLQIVSMGQNWQEIHCHFMLQFKNRLLTISEELLCVVQMGRLDQQVRYSMYRVPQLRKGYSMKAGIEYGKWVILAGEDGQLYKFQFSLQNDH